MKARHLRGGKNEFWKSLQVFRFLGAIFFAGRLAGERIVFGKGDFAILPL